MKSACPGKLDTNSQRQLEEARLRPIRDEFAKRFFDLSGALILLTLLGPLLIVIWLLVRLTSKGPAIYCQQRLGLNGVPYTMYKYRSMRQDAESNTGPVWASIKDSRVTALGRILRATRIDELPQLFNVVRGEMSLIGPRPERPEIAKSLESTLPSIRKRLRVRPGISGLAQVSLGYAASEDSYRRKVAYDILYIQKQSFWLDLSIAWRTIVVVITGRGSR